MPGSPVAVCGIKHGDSLQAEMLFKQPPTGTGQASLSQQGTLGGTCPRQGGASNHTASPSHQASGFSLWLILGKPADTDPIKSPPQNLPSVHSNMSQKQDAFFKERQWNSRRVRTAEYYPVLEAGMVLHTQFQHLESRGKWISKSLRPTWPIQGVLGQLEPHNESLLG